MHLAKGVRKLYKGAFYPFGDFLMRILSALSLSLTLGCTGPQLRPLVEGENDTGSSGEDTAQVEDTSDTGAVDTGRPLDSGERQEEIARMLSGAEVTDEARAAAGRLIGAA